MSLVHRRKGDVWGQPLLDDGGDDGGGGIYLPVIVKEAQAEKSGPRRSWGSNGSGSRTTKEL